MTKRTLRFRYHRGRTIPQGLLRQVWELRVEMLDLNCSPEEDWQCFSDFVRRVDTALLAFYDRQGAVQGFFTISYIPVEHAQQRGLLLFSKYFYFRREYRGHYKSILAPWILLPVSLSRYGARSLHFVASTYPQSFVSLSRTAGNVVALKSPNIGDWQRVALSRFSRAFFGEDFDETTGLIKNQNVVDTEALPRSDDAEQLYAEYERLNPHWRSGHSLPIMFSVNRSMLRNVTARTLRRVLPRSRKATAAS